MPKGYLIANLTVTDQAQYQAYRAKVGAVVAQFGGKFLVRGGTLDRVEPGAGAFDRVVVLEFESLEAAQLFYRSPEYAPLITMRAEASRSEVALVAGAD